MKLIMTFDTHTQVSDVATKNPLAGVRDIKHFLVLIIYSIIISRYLITDFHGSARVNFRFSLIPREPWVFRDKKKPKF